MKSKSSLPAHLIFTSPQPLPQVGGAKNMYIFQLPPSLLGEGGRGKRQKRWRRGKGNEHNVILVPLNIHFYEIFLE
jgi:hypothetical protein